MKPKVAPNGPECPHDERTARWKANGLEARGFGAKTARRWSDAIVEDIASAEELAMEFGVSTGHIRAFIARHGHPVEKANTKTR